MYKLCVTIAVVGVLSCVPLRVSAQVAQERVFAEVDGIQLVSMPQPSPGAGYSATMIQARAMDPAYSIVTLTNLLIANSHQVWADSEFAPRTVGPSKAGDLYGAGWIPYDSYLLIDPTMVGGGAGGALAGMLESNGGDSNLTLPSIVAPTIGEVAALSGYGDIAMQQATDAFFLLPDFQSNKLDLAYLVTADSRLEQVPVQITVGLLGSQGPPDTEFYSQFGYATPVNVPFPSVPEPATATLALFAAAVMAKFRRRGSR